MLTSMQGGKMVQRIRFLISTFFILGLITVLLVPLTDSLDLSHSAKVASDPWLEGGFSTQASTSTCSASWNCSSSVTIRCCGYAPCSASGGQVSCGGAGSLTCEQYDAAYEAWLSCWDSCQAAFEQCVEDLCGIDLIFCRVCSTERTSCISNCTLPSTSIGC